MKTLSKTIGIDADIVIVLDALRKQRNVADYSGDLVPQGAVTECIHQADELWVQLQTWLQREHPDLDI